MEINVKGKNLDVGEALMQRVSENLESAVAKYFSHAIDANVTFSREGSGFRADIALHPGIRGLVLKSTFDADDAHAAYDGAAMRISKQLRRYKRKLSAHHKRHGADETLPALKYVIQPEPDEEEIPEDASPAIIAETETEIENLSVSEAVMRMDLADLPVVVFRNSGNARISVVYRRQDGNVGWIEPATA